MNEAEDPGTTRADHAAAPPSPLEVLDQISLADVLALGSEGTEPVDWGALVRDTSGLCPDCGKPDGPRHQRRCIAHPRPPSAWWMAVAVFVVPLPLTLLFGPAVLVYFTPLLALGVYLRSR